METDKRISDLSAQVEVLPDDLVQDFLDRHRGSFRLTLSPGYRADTLFSRVTGCSHPYVLTASGFSVTNSTGTFTIKVADLLHCVRGGQPMPGGFMDPVETGSGTVFNASSSVAATGSPVTVVTSSGKAPAVFTATPSGSVQIPEVPGFILIGWRDAVTEASSSQEVVVRSFEPNGAPFPRATFNWHVTLEVRYLIGIGG